MKILDIELNTREDVQQYYLKCRHSPIQRHIGGLITLELLWEIRDLITKGGVMEEHPILCPKNGICRNCDMLKDGVCLVHGVEKQEDDMACYQLCNHYIGEKG